MVEISKRVGLDIDGCLANFSQGFIDAGVEMGIECCLPKNWKCVNKWMFPCVDHFKSIWDARCEHSYSFWLGLQPLPKAKRFFKSKKAFVPEVYITKRPCPSWVTRKWIVANGFPNAEVITVDDSAKKLDIILDRCDLYVDDLPATIRQCREAGANAYLYSAPFHVGESIKGLPIIKNFSDLYKLKELP
jgi:hypothetical protein